MISPRKTKGGDYFSKTRRAWTCMERTQPQLCFHFLFLINDNLKGFRNFNYRYQCYRSNFNTFVRNVT